jgi:hypothetical protein
LPVSLWAFASATFDSGFGETFSFALVFCATTAFAVTLASPAFAFGATFAVLATGLAATFFFAGATGFAALPDAAFATGFFALAFTAGFALLFGAAFGATFAFAFATGFALLADFPAAGFAVFAADFGFAFAIVSTPGAAQRAIRAAASRTRAAVAANRVRTVEWGTLNYNVFGYFRASEGEAECSKIQGENRIYPAQKRPKVAIGCA